MTNRVSVIIPVYQAESLVGRAVESALSQAPVGEIILVEDGSRDGSLSVCKRIAENTKKVKLYQHPDRGNHGAGATRNLGIERARCAFIAFLDVDDYYLPNRFEDDLQILLKRPDIDGIYSAVENVYEGNPREEQSAQPSLTTVVRKLDPHELFANMAPIGKFGFFHANGLTVRKSIFEKTGLFDVELLRSQDTHMWIKMAAVARLLPGRTEKPVARRRRHLEKALENREKMLSFRPTMFWKLFQWANANKIDQNRRIMLWDQYCYYRFLRNLHEVHASGLKTLCYLSLHAARYPFLLKSRKYYHRYNQALALASQEILSRTISSTLR